jgi:polysaccharide export outer membrane protein
MLNRQIKPPFSTTRRTTRSLRVRNLLAPLISICLVGACSTNDPSSEGAVSHRNVSLSADNGNVNGSPLVSKVVTVKPEYSQPPIELNSDYRVGPADELTVNVNGEAKMDAVVTRIDIKGDIQLPIIGNINVMGATAAEIQQSLVSAYTKEFVDPWIIVSVSKFRSRPVFMLGELNTPGVLHLERPTNVLQAVGLAGGLTDQAYLDGARLLRNKQIVAIDIEALLKQGRFDQNVWLQPDDTLYVPGYWDQKVFVLGAVNNPGTQPFRDSLSLLAAISGSGGVVGGQAKIKDTRILRTHSPIEGELIIVNVSDLLEGKTPDFSLRPGDIVFVPNSAIGSWNEVVSQIAPTLKLISGALEPFVQLQFLEGAKTD